VRKGLYYGRQCSGSALAILIRTTSGRHDSDPTSVSKCFYFFISQAAERERIKAAKEKASVAKAAAEKAAAEKAAAVKAAAEPVQSPGKAVEKDARQAYVKVS
jgi:hypothetical protein